MRKCSPGSNVSELAERVARRMHRHNDDQGSSAARGRSQSFPLYSPHGFMNNISPLPSVRALQDHAEEGPTCETSLPGRLTPGAEYVKAIENGTLISHKRVISEDSTGWTDPWDGPINPIYDIVTGKLIGAADIPRKVPYLVTDSEISEDSIQKKDNDSWSFMTHSNPLPGSPSDHDTESLDPLGIPKAHHWQSERATPAAESPNPPTHNVCGYLPPELRDEHAAANRKNRMSKNQLNRFYEIIDGHRQRFSNPQIGRDAAKQHENWRKAEAGLEQRIDNKKALSTRASHLIEPMDRRAPSTGWQQCSSSGLIPVSQDLRYNYARRSSPINSKDYFAPDVPTRFVTPSQEKFSDSRFAKPSQKSYSNSGFVKPPQKRFSDSRFVTPSQKQICDSRFVKPSQKQICDSRFVKPSQKQICDSRFVMSSHEYISDSRFVTSSHEHISDSRFVTPSHRYISDSRFVTPSHGYTSDSRLVTPSHEHISDSRFVTPSHGYTSDTRFVTPSHGYTSDSRFVTPSQEHISDSRFVTPSQKHISDSRFVTPSQKNISDSRFVTPSQEHCSDSRFLPPSFANHHPQRGHPRKYYNSSGRLGGWRSVKPSYNDAMMHHHPSSPRMHKSSARNPANYIRGAANSANSCIEKKLLPTLNVYRHYPHDANISSFVQGKDNYHGLDTVNHSLPSIKYYRSNCECTSFRTLRRSTNYENLRGLSIRMTSTNSTNKL